MVRTAFTAERPGSIPNLCRTAKKKKKKKSQPPVSLATLHLLCCVGLSRPWKRRPDHMRPRCGTKANGTRSSLEAYRSRRVRERKLYLWGQRLLRGP